LYEPPQHPPHRKQTGSGAKYRGTWPAVTPSACRERGGEENNQVRNLLSGARKGGKPWALSLVEKVEKKKKVTTNPASDLVRNLKEKRTGGVINKEKRQCITAPYHQKPAKKGGKEGKLRRQLDLELTQKGRGRKRGGGGCLTHKDLGRGAQYAPKNYRSQDFFKGKKTPGGVEASKAVHCKRGTRGPGHTKQRKLS